MKEIWKNIKDYEGLYQISNYGRVKSLKRQVNRINNKILTLKEKILKQQNMKNYKFVRLSKNGKSKQYFVHILVANAFLNKNNFKYDINENFKEININKLEVNHIDENPSNCKVNNLEWCTHRYNINYGEANKKRSIAEKHTKRFKNYNYKYIEHKGKKVLQYDLEENFIKEWPSIAKASRELKLNNLYFLDKKRCTIDLICSLCEQCH